MFYQHTLHNNGDKYAGGKKAQEDSHLPGLRRPARDPAEDFERNWMVTSRGLAAVYRPGYRGIRNRTGKTARTWQPALRVGCGRSLVDSQKKPPRPGGACLSGTQSILTSKSYPGVSRDRVLTLTPLSGAIIFNALCTGGLDLIGKAAVLKTAGLITLEGSNPSPSAR